MPLSKKVAVTTGGIHGRCWFSTEDIDVGELLWWTDESGDNFAKQHGMLVDLKTFESWPQKEKDRFMELGYQVDEDLLEGYPADLEVPQDLLNESFINHSCNGNSWFAADDHLKLYSLRPIPKGQEINYDYALTEAHPYFRIEKCLCGNSNCRTVITGEDWKLPDLQERYKGYFLPHVQAKIDRQK